jgi:hypothetical protein
VRLLSATCTANGVQKFILNLVRCVCVVFSDHLYVMVCTVSVTNCNLLDFHVPATVFLLNASLIIIHKHTEEASSKPKEPASKSRLDLRLFRSVV